MCACWVTSHCAHRLQATFSNGLSVCLEQNADPHPLKAEVTQTGEKENASLTYKEGVGLLSQGTIWPCGGFTNFLNRNEPHVGK